MSVAPQPHGRAWASSDDMAAFNLIVIAVGIAVGSYLLWTSYHAEISAAVMAVQHSEIAVIRHVSHRFDVADHQMAAADPAGVTLRDLYGITHEVGKYLRVPAVGVMLLLAGICGLRASPSRFKRRFDLDGLAQELSAAFPASAAFAGRHLKLAAHDPKASVQPCDVALTAPEWVDRYARDASGEFDASAARWVLIGQLGTRWSGPETAGEPARIMFAAFALHLAKQRAAAIDLLGRASKSLAMRGTDPDAAPDIALVLPPAVVREADAVIANAKVAAAARRIAERHAYTHPALMSVLNLARLQAGVLAPAQFAWLRFVDRGLWYALHSLGFESEDGSRYLHPNARVEAIGARDHWAAERMAAVSITQPAIERALEAVRRAADQRPKHEIGPS